MRQLGELGKSAEKFKAAGAEVIAVFREEKKEVEGLKAIVERKPRRRLHWHWTTVRKRQAVTVRVTASSPVM